MAASQYNTPEVLSLYQAPWTHQRYCHCIRHPGHTRGTVTVSGTLDTPEVLSLYQAPWTHQRYCHCIRHPGHTRGTVRHPGQKQNFTHAELNACVKIHLESLASVLIKSSSQNNGKKHFFFFFFLDVSAK